MSRAEAEAPPYLSDDAPTRPSLTPSGFRERESAFPAADAPMDVLVVDDEEGPDGALALAVAALGYPVRTAHNGREALAEHTRRPAAIVLTDWSMPVMTGLELCMELKRLPKAPHVVVMSGYDGRSRLLEALRAGADEFIAKPIDFEELEVRLLASARMVNTQRALDRRNEALRRQGEREFKKARTDPLTSIPNRLRMEEDLARAVDEAARYGRRYCVAMCDVDHFKRYNDGYGHLEGDMALQQVAAALRDGVRSSDAVYRFGGEEFVILFPEQTPDEVMLAVDRIRVHIEGLGIENRSTPQGVLTISAGIAEVGTDGTKGWLARADAALYRAKAGGRNRVARG